MEYISDKHVYMICVLVLKKGTFKNWQDTNPLDFLWSISNSDFVRVTTITGVSPFGKPNFRSVLSNPWVPVQGFEVWRFTPSHGGGWVFTDVFVQFQNGVTWDKVPSY